MPAAPATGKADLELKELERLRKENERLRKEIEASETDYLIIAPVANPNHPQWNDRNPFKDEYAELHGTFELQVDPILTRTGRQLPPQEIPMFAGKGYTTDKEVADWIKGYYGYEVKRVKGRDSLVKTMEAVANSTTPD